MYKSFFFGVLSFSLLCGPFITYSAQLPDEINIPKYRQIYESAKFEENQQKEVVDRLSTQLSSLERTISIRQNDLRETRREVTDLNERLRNLFYQNGRMQAEIGALHEKNRQINQEIRRLTHIHNGLLEDLNVEQRELRALEIYLDSIEQKLKDKERKLRSVQASYNQQLDAVQGAEKNLSKKTKELQRKEDEKILLITEITELEDDIVRLSRSVSEKEQRVIRLTSTKRTLQQAVSKLNQEAAPLKLKVSEYEGKLQKVMTKMRPLESQITQNKAKITQLQKDLDSNKSKVSQAKKDISQKKREISLIPQKIRELQAEIQLLKAKNSELTAKISSDERQEQSLKGQVQKITQEINRLRRLPRSPDTSRKISQLETKKRTLLSRLSTIQSNLNRAKKKLVQNKNKVISLERNKSSLAQREQSLKGEIQSLKSEISRLNSKITSLTSSLETITNQQAGLKSQLMVLKNKKGSIGQKLHQFKESLKVKQSKFAELSRQLNETKKSIQRLERDILTAQRQLTNAQNKIPRLQTSLRALNNLIPRLKNDVQRLASLLFPLKKELDKRHKKLVAVQNKVDKITRERNEQASLVAQQTDLVKQLKRRVYRLAEDITEQRAKISRNIEEIRSKEKAVQRNVAIIRDTERRITDLERFVISLGQEIHQLLRDQDELSRRYETELNYLENLERESSLALRNLRDREELYNNYLVEAQEIGRTQGEDFAREKAEVDSQELVNTIGTEVGTRIGREIGLLDGYLNGLLKGKQTGKEEGYRDGVNSEDDFEQGYNAGLKLGKVKATEVAMSEDFPQSYREKREELLKDVPREQITLDNGTSRLPESEIEYYSSENKILANEMMFFTDESSYKSEMDELMSFTSGIDTEINKVRKELSEFDQPQRNLSRPEFVYSAPQKAPVDRSLLDCSNIYRNVEAFIVACENSYVDFFKQQYFLTHQNIFFQDYSEIYSQFRERGFDQHKDVDFDKGSKKAYKVVYPEAFAEGAEVAHANGIDEGTTDGFNSNIENERRVAVELGVRKATTLFKNSGVVRVQGNNSLIISPLNPKGLIQGAKAKLGLMLVNAGHQVTNLGDIQVSFRALTDNIEIIADQAGVISLPERKIIELKNVSSFQVDEHAIPGTPIIVEATIRYPGDDVDQDHVQKVLLRDKVKVNPELKVTVDYQKKTKWRKWKFWPFSWKYRTEKIKVNLFGIRDHVPNGYQVELEIIDGNGIVKADTPIVESPRVRRGELQTVSLSYTFLAKAKKAKLKMKVTVSYEGELIKEKIINMVTK